MLCRPLSLPRFGGHRGRKACEQAADEPGGRFGGRKFVTLDELATIVGIMPNVQPPVLPEVESFGALVREHQAGLRAFVRMLGADAASVDDLAQEVFLVAWRRMADFDAGTDFGKWLRGIARHLLTNERRKEARRARLLPGAVTDLLLEHADGGALAAFDLRRLVPLMEECVGQLPPRNRELLRRRYAGSENATELARELCMRADTMRQTLLRIRIVVKECIERKSAEALP